MMEVVQSSQKKITILHVVSNISVRSGIMSCIMNYYRNMNGVRFVFLYFDSREITYEEEIKSLGGEVIKLSSPKNVINFFSDLSALKERYINVFDIIELHDPFMVTFFARLKKQLKIKKMIVHAHSTRFSDSRLGEIRNRLLSIGNIFLPDAYFACSSLAGERIFGKKFIKNGSVIYNAIDLSRFMKNKCRDSLREKYRISESFAIVHIGNFAEPKNHPFIISIFEEICKLRNDAVLVLIGDGERRPSIEKMVKDKQLQSKVLFLGARTDVNELLQMADCFLFPSKYEGLGMAVVEAQAAGIPCVISNMLPEETNVLTMQNKVLSLNDSPVLWAKAICESKKEQIDTFSLLSDAGFNILRESTRVQEIYYRMLGE